MMLRRKNSKQASPRAIIQSGRSSTSSSSSSSPSTTTASLKHKSIFVFIVIFLGSCIFISTNPLLPVRGMNTHAFSTSQDDVPNNRSGGSKVQENDGMTSDKSHPLTSITISSNNISETTNKIPNEIDDGSKNDLESYEETHVKPSLSITTANTTDEDITNTFTSNTEDENGRYYDNEDTENQTSNNTETTNEIPDTTDDGIENAIESDEDTNVKPSTSITTNTIDDDITNTITSNTEDESSRYYDNEDTEIQTNSNTETTNEIPDTTDDGIENAIESDEDTVAQQSLPVTSNITNEDITKNIITSNTQDETKKSDDREGIEDQPSMLIDYKQIFDSVIKTRSGVTWKVIDYDTIHEAFNDTTTTKTFECEDWHTFTSPNSGKSSQMCVHNFFDIVSRSIRTKGHWIDCNGLSNMWEESKIYQQFINNVTTQQQPQVLPIYVEIGGNIGACVMEMLHSTNAPIIVFEPNPKNYLVMKETMRRLDEQYQKRVVLFPVALGSKRGRDTIYSAHNNMGNSVVGTIIKDSDSQQFPEDNQFEIPIERLDDILMSYDNSSSLSLISTNNTTSTITVTNTTTKHNNNDTIVMIPPSSIVPDIGLMKMDAQGFECHILDGIGQDLGTKIHNIHFEIATKWLDGQNCTNLLPKFRGMGMGMELYKTKNNGEKMFLLPENDVNYKPGIADLNAIRVDRKKRDLEIVE